MRCLFLISYFLLFFSNVNAQKVINNPDCIANNISGTVTKVELSDKETIIHMHIRASIGNWIYIPKKTYIEDSEGKGNKVYITKAEGISLNKKVFYESSDEKRFKLYFPPLPKDYQRINYGESNKGGNWFIYKLDLRKDGKGFIKNSTHVKYTIKYDKDKKVVIPGFNLYNNTILPKDLPKDLFGNWYDKHGTLILITTPDYLVLNNRIKYYNNIQKIGEKKYKIITSSDTFEILDLNNKELTIRTNRIITLNKKSSSKKTPKSLKGKWLHWEKIKEITITDDYFYNNDKGASGQFEVIKSKIDHVAESNDGSLIWFVLYNHGNYNIYFAKKTDHEYILQPRGFNNAKYQKVKN